MKSAARTALTILAALAAVFVWRIFATEQFEKLMAAYGGHALKLWTDPFFYLGGLAVSPAFLLKAGLFLVLLVAAARGGRALLRKQVLAKTSIDPGQQYALEVGTGYLIFVLGLVVGLQSVGLNLSSLAFLTGIVGVGVGFGLQNIVNNFVSGLILLVERPIKVGDRVEVGGLIGDIVRIAARSTWVRTNDNVVIIVPNSEFISMRVTNWTANDRQVRVKMSVGVSYASDPLRVRDLLLEIARSEPTVLADPAPDVIFCGFGESTLDFDLRVWTEVHMRTPQNLTSNLYYRIFQAFQEHSIEIPSPQRDVHLRSAPAQPNGMSDCVTAP